MYAPQQCVDCGETYCLAAVGTTLVCIVLRYMYIHRQTHLRGLKLIAAWMTTVAILSEW